jgi:hypothetical protein
MTFFFKSFFYFLLLSVSASQLANAALSNAELAELKEGKIIEKLHVYSTDGITSQEFIAYIPNQKPFNLMAIFWDYEAQTTYLNTLKSLEYISGTSSDSPKTAEAVPSILGISLEKQILEYKVGIYPIAPKGYWSSWKTISKTEFPVTSGEGRISFEQFAKGTLVFYSNSFKPTNNFGNNITKSGLKATFKKHLKYFKSSVSPTEKQIRDLTNALYY